MEEYDVLVVGSGAGMNIASQAVEHGLKVAMVDKDPIGGTCMNRGCVPSKTMIYPADLIQEAKEAENLGVEFSELDIDFDKIMERTRESYLPARKQMKESIEETENFHFYNERARFIDEYTMEVSGKTIKADKIFLFSGSRSEIPSIDGIDEVDYLTNRNIFDMSEIPESLMVIGGGYIGIEFAHFFSAIGTEVTVVELKNRLFSNLDSDITELLEKKLSSRMNILTGHEVTEIRQKDGKKFAIAENSETGEERELNAESTLIAVGRRSNADLLEVEKTGVETDEKGWIKVDDYLETDKENIWAGGDATGQYMFRHVANYDASIALHNAFSDHRKGVDYHAVPYAVFTHPQIAGVGLGIEEAKKEREVAVAKGRYKDTARGYAMGNVEGFCKIIIDAKDRTLLGAHIIGPQASVLIHELVNLMYAADGKLDSLYDSLHIHPSLSEVITWSLGDFEKV
uniref:Pyridine nucleotide-disulfide oxidoreductase dimerization region n=1 Tax=uncultured organism TaxID=155900 RepID=M1PQH9_9ZZZZ|nr:pyridine nucleotide-disulfide oxidoreductase dimerization region [uncultured organism]